MKVKWLSRVRLLATPWTTAYQAPPSMGFSRQEYCSGVPSPSPIARREDYKYKRIRKVLTIWSNYLDQQRLEFINWNWLQVTVTHVEQETGQQGIERCLERFLS